MPSSKESLRQKLHWLGLLLSSILIGFFQIRRIWSANIALARTCRCIVTNKSLSLSTTGSCHWLFSFAHDTLAARIANLTPYGELSQKPSIHCHLVGKRSTASWKSEVFILFSQHGSTCMTCYRAHVAPFSIIL
jgi:hypothetical protein